VIITGRKKLKSTLVIISCILVSIICNCGNHSSNQNNRFTNPILAGFYPDPSICSVDQDYYLVNSTFAYYPGIPVFHSKDLVNWKLIGHVLDRPEQLNLDSMGVSRGIFAPAIRYNQGIFYVTCTLVDGGGNFIVISKTAAGPWSNPVWLPQLNGIDPSMFFDDDGRQAFIVYNSIAPDDKPLYQGHRTIRMYEFDPESLKVAGQEYILVNGGTDISKKPVWIEGPHIFKKDGYYYLIAAEGGTAEGHSEVVFRSSRVEGPYTPYEHNPILTQRHLDAHRDIPVTSTGHADLVQLESGDWWAVFLGCRPYRPYDQNFYNTGRETFLAPVKWVDGWPVINPGHEQVQYYYPYPAQSAAAAAGHKYSGNFRSRDEFDAETLNPDWMSLRTPGGSKWYDLQRRQGFLALRVRPESCAEKVNPSFLGHRQQHLQGSASTALVFSAAAENEKAGLLVFQNETHFYFLCQSLAGQETVVQLYKSAGKEQSAEQMELMGSQKVEARQGNPELYLKIAAEGNVYSFLYTTDRVNWQVLKDNVDATFLSTRVAGGFVGCVYALYATSLGQHSKNTAYFDWFEYAGDDEIYR
jgi:xylan 1,4-beta-xylosidase